jgi:cytoskeleton protein RodZ
MASKPKKSDEIEADTTAVEEVLADANAENQADGIAEAVQDSHSQCGGALKAARAAQGLTANDVAKQLRLSSMQIEALEEDRFSQLPEATIVKGFIRNYAKLLRIPAAPLLVAYAEMMPEKEDYSFTLNPGINMKITEHKKSNKAQYFLLAAGLFLGVGVWFFYHSYIQKPSPVNPIPEIIEALPELALPMSERAEDLPEISKKLNVTEPSAGLSAVESNNAESISPAARLDDESLELESDSTQGEQQEDIVVEGFADTREEAVADAAPATGKTRLKFSATQETWLSVVNASGKEVYNKILYAGNQDVVDIWQPSQIVVGNAHGASLEVDGKPIDLAPYTRINVARVHLDR